MQIRKALLLAVSIICVCGCCAKEVPVKKEPEVKAPLSKADELRQKAKIAEAASLVGYDGKAIHADLDKLIDNQEKAAKQLEDMNDIR